MFSTIILATVLIGMLLFLIVSWTLFLWLGLRWAKVPDITVRRLIAATVAVFVAQIAMNGLSLLLAPASDEQALVLAIVELAFTVIISCAIISMIFKTRFLRAFQAWLSTLLAPILAISIALLVVRPFLYETFMLSANAMAPTLVGNHRQGVCPECGQPSYCSPTDERQPQPFPPTMICDNFHLTQESDVNRNVQAGDRIMVAKFLTPLRWDLVVFQAPGNPETQYVKRLIGFPGETIHIEDGSVWVNGTRQTPPESIRGIEYLSQIPQLPTVKLWGSKNQPALLGDDEYFVLGDYSAKSLDSRVWKQGAPGHNPFAVPESYLQGVVTHTYWPFHRWRIHR